MSFQSSNRPSDGGSRFVASVLYKLPSRSSSWERVILTRSLPIGLIARSFAGHYPVLLLRYTRTWYAKCTHFLSEIIRKILFEEAKRKTSLLFDHLANGRANDNASGGRNEVQRGVAGANALSQSEDVSHSGVRCGLSDFAQLNWDVLRNKCCVPDESFAFAFDCWIIPWKRKRHHDESRHSCTVAQSLLGRNVSLTIKTA